MSEKNKPGTKITGDGHDAKTIVEIETGIPASQDPSKILRRRVTSTVDGGKSAVVEIETEHGTRKWVQE